MRTLSAKLRGEDLVVTAELTPPKGTNLDPLVDQAERLSDVVDAFNVTDSHGAKMRIGAIATGHRLLDRCIEPIVQLTTRDRNRIALQGDMLGAAALGIRNVVCMGGDPPKLGDHPEAKPVFDLETAELIRAAAALNDGHDLAGGALTGSPAFCIGAVVNPGAEDLTLEVRRLEEKVAAGARFVQTQAVYEAPRFLAFLDRIRHIDVAVLAGILPIKSEKMARYLNARVPGIEVPEAQIEAVATARNAADTSCALAAETIAAVRSHCAGIHLMTLGWEEHIPTILRRAGLRAAAAA